MKVVTDQMRRRVWIHVHEKDLMKFIRLYRDEASKSAAFGHFDQLSISASKDMESFHVHFDELGVADMDAFLVSAAKVCKTPLY